MSATSNDLRRGRERFGLIKNEQKLVEKRVFPRFPFGLMTFRVSEGKTPQQDGHVKVFEVRDISFSGMHLALKDGGHTFIQGASIGGQLLWKGTKILLDGQVAWCKGQELGIAFKANAQKELGNLLSLKHLAQDFRPLHLNPFESELPANLKIWLKSDGPAELFVWQHGDGELSRFQFLLFDHFIEWEDGRGLKTGHLLSIKDIDTPLNFEDEIEVEIDEDIAKDKIRSVLELLNHVTLDLLPERVANFIRLKLT